MKSSLKIGFNVTFQSINSKTKEVVREEKYHNMVVNAGLEVVASYLATTFTHVGIGTGNTAVSASDTELDTEYTREAVTATSGGTGIRTWDHTFTVASGVSEDIIEAGLFDSATASGSTMFNRSVSGAAFTLDSDNDLRVVITVTASDS